jgi:hypothetical protein
MNKIPEGLALPKTLDDINAGFMTALLRARGLISESNFVSHTDESDVGMTAGYFSAIKRIKCHFNEPTEANSTFVVKAWPDIEIAPKETIGTMFERDIMAYQLDTKKFFPCPKIYLADFDASSDCWALIMDDVSEFADQKLHEQELNFEEVRHMIPKLVDLAVAWEGCHEGELSDELELLNIPHWSSDENLATFKQIMPGGAKLFDYVTNLQGSSLVGEPLWNGELGDSICELMTNKIDAFYRPMHAENGATCTLSHGDLRGDNLFFCEKSNDYPDGWLTIDYQLMFKGPVPSDLAYLMNSGSVLPEVYTGENREKILREFYDGYMAKTTRYPDYTWEQFNHEYSVMATVLFIYYVGFGGSIWQAGIDNEQPGRVELGNKGETEADLAPDELRKRMWWTKAMANFRTTFKEYDHHGHLSTLPTNQGEIGEWFEVPDRLQV